MPEVPFAFQWSVDENELLPLKDSVNGCLLSDTIFDVSKIDLYFGIYPNGHNDQYRGQTWIFFFLEFANIKNVEVEYTIKIESANFSKTNDYIYEQSKGQGPKLCTTEEFFDPEKKFFVDGKCTIKIDGIFEYEIDDANSDVIQEYKWEGGELGDQLWKKEDTKDFTIIADEKEINVHKVVLDSRSDVFSAMLKSNMKEATENKVTIPDFSFNVVETAIKIIYDCNFTSSLSLDELMELLQFFDKYNLSTLKAKVEPFLIDQISPSTVVDLTNCSILTNSFKLKEKCMEYMSAALASKTPLADIDDLDKDIALEVLKNSLYQIIQTEK